MARGVENKQLSRRRSLPFIGAMLAALALSLCAASSASALSIGMSWNGNLAQTQDPGEWDAVKRSGSTVFRVAIERNQTAGGTNWSAYDPIFDRAAKRGITILPYLCGETAQGGRFPVKSEYGSWTLWAKQVVRRYGYGGDFWAGKSYAKPATAWEVWNETNLPVENPIINGKEGVYPENYGAFLKEMASAIRAAQAEKSGTPTQVLNGGLYMGGIYGLKKGSQKNGEGILIYYTETYLEKLGTTTWDALSIHPYSVTAVVANAEGEVETARAVENSLGGSGKALWITELGWPVEFNNLKEEHGQALVNESVQRDSLQQSFDWIKGKAAAYNINSLYWYESRDYNRDIWQDHAGLRRQNGSPRPAWAAFLAQTGAAAAAPNSASEIGFLRYNTPGNTRIDTYVGPPSYLGHSSLTGTGYPAVPDPQNIQGLPIDTNGDGVDEVGFVRYNQASGHTHIDTYSGAPNYKTLNSFSDTGYPNISDPQNLQALGIDYNGDSVDELGFLRFNQASGHAHIDLYGGAPNYDDLSQQCDTGYPAISDPQNVQAVAIDTDGDGVDELGYVRLNQVSGHAHIDIYSGQCFTGLLAFCDTGYPAISDPQNVQAMAVDTNGDGIDELGFLRLNQGSGYAHLDTYTSSCYQTLNSFNDTGQPAISDPANVQAMALNWTNDPNPGGWYKENIGGSINSDPDIASWGSGHLDLFAKGTNNHLMLKGYDTTQGWRNWEDLGGSLASGPAAVSYKFGRIDVVARATNNTLTHWWWDNGAGWFSENLGGSINSDPDIASWGSGHLDIFARGTNNHLMLKGYDTTQGWRNWEDLGGSLASGPGATSTKFGRLDVVARASDNTVTHWWWDNGAGWFSDNLGGNIASDPEIAKWDSNRLDVFAKSPSNTLVHKWWTGSWSEWEDFGDPSLASGPGAVSWGSKFSVAARASQPENTVSLWSWVDP